MTITKQDVLDAVALLMRRRFDVVGECDKTFHFPCGSPDKAVGAPTKSEEPIAVVADLYLPAPLHCIVQFDDAAHCTRERAATFATYPPETPLNFDVRRYLADRARGNDAVAQADVLADLLPPKHGLNPTVRIRADEVGELTGPLADRIESLLSCRFAFHAGTTFHLMVENAGAKPHRTLGS